MEGGRLVAYACKVGHELSRILDVRADMEEEIPSDKNVRDQMSTDSKKIKGEDKAD